MWNEDENVKNTSQGVSGPSKASPSTNSDAGVSEKVNATSPADKGAQNNKEPSLKSTIQSEGQGLDRVPFQEKEKGPEEVRDSASEEEFKQAIYGVPVKVTALLGTADMSVQHLVKLGRGAVVQLNKKVGEPVDIMVNDRLVAKGEVVLLDGTLGITLTELIKAETV